MSKHESSQYKRVNKSLQRKQYKIISSEQFGAAKRVLQVRLQLQRATTEFGQQDIVSSFPPKNESRPGRGPLATAGVILDA
jgi:hypothetical protein